MESFQFHVVGLDEGAWLGEWSMACVVNVVVVRGGHSAKLSRAMAKGSIRGVVNGVYG